MLQELSQWLKRYYVVPLSILASFVLWFANDIYTLKKALMHPDLITYYYPYRYWFSQQLLSGQFPLWNPYWGIGQVVEWALTFPIDIYTVFEMIFGPKYHYFQTIQLLVFLFAVFYTFIKLDFKPLISVAAAILYFMSPYVTYFNLYFMLTHSFIGNVLLFLFIYKWFETECKKYLLFITWIIIFTMFGTKAEFWFFNAVMFGFYAFVSAIIFYNSKFRHSIKLFFLSILFMGIGVLAHLWQLNMLVRVMGMAERTTNATLLNLFSTEMYHNLFLSIAESELLKILGVGLLFYLGIRIKKWFSWIFLLFGVIAVIVLKLWALPVMVSFIKSPIFIGSIIGLFFSVSLSRFKNLNWQDYIKTTLLFLLLVYYWCRPGIDEMSEMYVIFKSPTAFKILLSALVWLGCTEFERSKLAKLAYFSILFVFFMREMGQVLLSYLAGMVWIPTRDNYIIDFAITVLAVLGLNTLDSFSIYNKYKKIQFSAIASAISIGIIVFSVSPNLFYSHWMMMKTPPDFPYYTDVPEVRKVIRELRDTSLSRVFIVNKPTISMTYGLGSSLFENVGQVTLYSASVPKNYKDWALYQRTGIKPEGNWGGYQGEYSAKKINRLPKRNTLGLNNGELYFYTLIARPPLGKNVLKLLGVKYVLVFDKSLSHNIGDPFDLKNLESFDKIATKLDIKNIKKISKNLYFNQNSTNDYKGKDLYADESLIVGQLSEPLSRSFVVSDVTVEKSYEFMHEMSPVINDDNSIIKTKSFEFPIVTSAHIEKYESENISISIEANEKNSYLVLSDLYHPFWHVRIDGNDAEIIPAFSIFRGVKVPAGKHQIDFYYKVPYFVLTVIVSLLITIFSTLGVIYYKYYNCCYYINPTLKGKVVLQILLTMVISIFIYYTIDFNVTKWRRKFREKLSI